jgi:hypothetical protein
MFILIEFERALSANRQRLVEPFSLLSSGAFTIGRFAAILRILCKHAN